jgi:hypothetical protein
VKVNGVSNVLQKPILLKPEKLEIIVMVEAHFQNVVVNKKY